MINNLLYKLTFNLTNIIITILTINVASANLMIAPQRIVFEERERSASVNLINTSNTSTTYRLSWVQKKQTANSRYIDIPLDSNEVPSATSMLRFSPRQVTLGPGEKQTVRIALRRKKNLDKNEYRSHLLFQALPSQNNNSQNKKNAEIKINLLLGFAIPIIIRKGSLNGKASIIDVKIQKTINKGEAFYGALIKIKRKGIHSTHGTLKLFWKPQFISTYKEIAVLNNITLYPESDLVQYYIGLTTNPDSGYLKVIYQGRKEYDGVIFDTKETHLKKNNIAVKVIK